MAKSSEIKLGKTFMAGVWENNPVLRLLLGMCPVLAVTAAVKPALTMGLSVIFVLLFSNIVVSLLRHQLKPHVRILMFTLTIATAVTIADLYLKAFMPEMSASLGPFIPLIIVNCIIIGRAEACASKNGLLVSITDALGMGAGFTITLCVLAAIREVLGTGCIFDYEVLNVCQEIKVAVENGVFILDKSWFTMELSGLFDVVESIKVTFDGSTFSLVNDLPEQVEPILNSLKEIIPTSANGSFVIKQDLFLPEMQDAYKALAQTPIPLSQDYVTLNTGWFVPWAGMGMPVGAFITLGLMLAGVNLITKKTQA